MYPSSKSERHTATETLVTAGKLLATVATLVLGVLLVVPLGALFMVKWAAGMVYDALREPRGQE